MAREWLTGQTIGSLVDARARRDSAREALVFQDRRWSFAELARDVDDVARGLLHLGIRPGDRVALWMVNRPEWIHAALAVMRIGAVLVPVNTRFRTDDLAYVLGQSDSAALIIAARSGPVDYLGMVRALLPSLGSGDIVQDAKLSALRRVVLLGEAAPGTVAWPALLDGGAHVSPAALRARVDAVDPTAAAFLMYTSGTTGFPKGAMHGHAIVRNVADRAWRMAITHSDTILMYLPLYHLFGFSEGMLSHWRRAPGRSSRRPSIRTRAYAFSRPSARPSSTVSTPTSRTCSRLRRVRRGTSAACGRASSPPACRARSRSPARRGRSSARLSLATA